ncbi:unnamed protein product [Sphenostylis stenocarpa]|uniref:non-specific serine/threonine protein kinase n=1 Tax=Sphenostylis stenocarpa TaxID=92480 RepID=A0AA86SJ82_9FABA|nr:unnamed protein product [Sphenostylis stenocarpa]
MGRAEKMKEVYKVSDRKDEGNSRRRMSLQKTWESLNSDISYPSSVQHIGCMKQDKNQSYVFLAGDEDKNGYGWLRQCEDHVVVTVKQKETETSDLITGFGDTMKKGFVLDWMRAKDCAVCEESNGYCRFDHTTKQSSCLCIDGRTVSKSCKKGPSQISVMPHPLVPPPSSLINTLFFFSLFFPTSISSDAEGYTACDPFSCGKFDNISYPFWSKDQQDYCGHPKFMLDCQQDNVTIGIMSQTFQVIDMDQISKVLKIARLDLWTNPCTNDYVNVKLDSNFFSNTSNDVEYTLLYDCGPLGYASSSVNIGGAIQFNCRIGGDLQAGFFVLSTEVVNFNSLSCKNSITVYVLKEAVKNDSVVDNVLGSGFEVGWSGANEHQCNGCSKSGGRCGHNASVDAFMCLCPNQQSDGEFCKNILARPPEPTPRSTPEKSISPTYHVMPDAPPAPIGRSIVEEASLSTTEVNNHKFKRLDIWENDAD